MTPKEKAEELVNQYRMILMDEDTDCGNEILCSLIAIKNALIAVEEIINTEFQTVTKLLDVIQKSKIRLVMSLNVDYWQEVKKEIEKL
jgi:hypothetical protein